MKKAFNFRTLLACALILVMCLTAFVACDKDKDQEQPYDANGINLAVRALKANVRSSSVNADFTLDNHQMFAGISYPVSWAITANDGEASDVTLTVDGDKTTVHVNRETKTEVKFTLTATVSDAKGLTATAEFKFTIPAYTLMNYKEYKEAKAGSSVTIQGTVSIISSKAKGNKYNKMYLFDEDGGYYVYSTLKDPTTVGVELGMKVEIGGTKSSYGNIENASITIIDRNKTVDYEDITNEVFAASSMKDSNLVAREYRFVTIKNVVIGDVDEENSYYKFSIGANETYLRISSSECMLLGDDQTNFINTFKANKGKIADVKGVVSVYSDAMYLVPVGTDALTVKEIAEKTPAEQIEDAKTRVFTSTTVYGTGSVVKLSNADTLYPNVKIAWTASDAKAVVAADNASVTYNFDADATVKLTATLTHSEDASLSETKEFTVNLVSAIPVSISEFLAKEKGNIVYSITGWVVAKQTEGKTKGSFVIADKTGAVFSYEGDAGQTIELGSYVTVWGTRSENGSIPQITPTKFIAATTTETYEPTVEKEFDMADINLANEKASDYTGKLLKITGVSVSTGEKTDRIYLATAKGSCLHAFTLRSELKNVTEGQNVTVYGYCRGLSSTYLSIQLVKIEAEAMSDADKVAYVKETLEDMTVNKDFDLPTSDVATITWAIKGATTAATLAGNKVTINQTDADQTVVFTATIVSGDANDTKDITVTIKAKDNRVAGVKGVEGKAYKIVMNQTTLNKTLYLNGKMAATYYFGTTENVDEAVDVYLEVVSEEDGTFRLYTTIDNAKKYIEIVPSGSHINVKFNDTVAGNPWTWNDTLKMYQTAVSGATGKEDGNYTLGTFSDKNTFSAQIVTSTNSFFAQLYGTPDPAPVKTDEEKVAEAKEVLALENTTLGAGTLTLPATGINGTTITWVSDNAAIAIAEDGVTATIGTVTENTTVKLTATITLNAASATKEIEVTVTATTPEYTVTFVDTDDVLFKVKNGETTLATGNKVEQGTTITITVVYNEDDYTITVKVNGTAITGAEGVYTYQVTGDVEITAELKENLNTPEKIVNAAYALAKDTSLEGTYTLTGKIISVDAVYDTQHKNVTVTIVVGDMTDKPIQCFRMKGTDADKVAVNDTITVTGTLVNYNGTVEFNSGCSLDARVVGTSTISVSEESSANATVTITDGLTSGENGTTFTFTVAVASGHELVSVKVNNKVVDAAEGQYTCTINGNMVIVVETKAEGTAAPVVIATATFGASTNSGKIRSYTDKWSATCDGVKFDIENFNNNNNGWAYIKCGRNGTASVANIATNAAMANAITKVVVTIDAVTTSAVNSIKLVVASDAEFANVVETIDGTVAKGDMTFNISADKQAANLYYKVVFDCNASATKNGPVQVSKVQFYGFA